MKQDLFLEEIRLSFVLKLQNGQNIQNDNLNDNFIMTDTIGNKEVPEIEVWIA